MGSEMCIRDRRNRFHPLDAGDAFQVGAGHPALRHHPHEVRPVELGRHGPPGDNLDVRAHAAQVPPQPALRLADHQLSLIHI